MANKKIWFGILVIALVFGMTVVGCSNGSTSSSTPTPKDEDVGTFLNGTWSRDSGKYAFKLSGNTWIYSENGSEYSKGTWKSSVKPAAGVTTTLTLTVTNIKSGSSWGSVPSAYNDVKTNTAKCVINAAGNQMTISDAALTTDGVWGTLQGTYTKQ